jgi:leucine dehydrogenase
MGYKERFHMPDNSSKHAAHPHVHYTVYDSLIRYAEKLNYGEIHTKIDTKTGLIAIIAIHSLKRGPAIGGCRMVHYPTIDKAVEDVLRLGHMMSYKAAINNLAHGGAKSVLIKPNVMKDKEAYFEKFGEFIQELNGIYITAVDSGTTPAEMDIIARRTSFVTCTTKSGADGDPSPLTALGVRRAIEAAIKFKLNKDTLDGIRVAIQGAGHVGYCLAKELKEKGAHIIMSDINANALQRCVDAFGVETCTPEQIFSINADVFSPCALGAIINRNTIDQIIAPIVAGSANNQLAHHRYGTLLHERGILYAPDFLINSGGLIHVAVIYDRGDLQQSVEQIKNIYHIVYDIFERSKRENKPTSVIAEDIAKERLA